MKLLLSLTMYFYSFCLFIDTLGLLLGKSAIIFIVAHHVFLFLLPLVLCTLLNDIILMNILLSKIQHCLFIDT